MTRIAVAGAAGRMGQRIVACILNDVGGDGQLPPPLGFVF
jgi:dihydrodipicolinate reductase